MSLGDIRGQDRQIAIIQSAIRKNTLAHAYLFTGIPGIGKMTVARALAKILHCTTAPDDFCDSCIPCRQINGGTHPDIMVIEPEGDSIKINQIRRMQEQIAYTSYGGNYKIVIVDRADRMTMQSANCLLKTLEEPPPHTLLFLLTSIPYQLPPTIRSRCQRLMFQPLSERLITELLQEKLGGQKPADIQLIASLAGGSLGEALRWTESTSLSDRKTLLVAINHLNTASVSAIFACTELLGEDKEGVLEKLDLIKVWLRDCAVGKLTNSSQYFINKDLAPTACTVSARASWINLFEKLQIVNETQAAVHGNVNIRLATEAMLLRLSH